MTDCSFSIVIPTHNRPSLLLRAVRSALAECRAGGEVVVVDDASNRPARDVLQPLNDPRLRVVDNPGPHGAASARNRGVAAARGEVVFFLDDDDCFMEGYIARILGRLQDSCDADYGFSTTMVVSGGGQTALNARNMPTGPVPRKAPLRRKVHATSAGFWVRRAVFMQLGGFDPALKVDEDTDLCVRLAARGHKAWHEAEPGTQVFLDHCDTGGQGAQLTRATPDRHAAGCYLRSYENSADDFPPLSEARWWLATRYIRRAVKAGDAEAARRFIATLRPLPFRWAVLGYWRLRVWRQLLRRQPVTA